MTMISPKAYIESECEGKSYKELLKMRDELLKGIYAFEKGKISPRAWMIKPSPEVKYQMNLEYLSELCKLIAETYRIEVVWKDEEEE